MLTAKSCELFELPFFQFSELKKYQPEAIPQIKTDYKQAWNQWKYLILQVGKNLATPFIEPYIEKWCNGWQARAHFFAYFKYEYHQNSAAILSVLLNRRRLQVSLNWHCYRADRSQINVEQYNQWLMDFDFIRYVDFDLWRGDDSEYNDFKPARQFSQSDLNLRNSEDFWCIGKNLAKEQLAHTDCAEFITQTIR